MWKRDFLLAYIIGNIILLIFGLLSKDFDASGFTTLIGERILYVISDERLLLWCLKVVKKSRRWVLLSSECEGRYFRWLLLLIMIILDIIFHLFINIINYKLIYHCYSSSSYCSCFVWHFPWEGSIFIIWPFLQTSNWDARCPRPQWAPQEPSSISQLYS